MKRPPKTPKTGTSVFVNYGSGYIHEVTFLTWCRMRCKCGGPDTHKIGTGAIVSSTWLFAKTLIGKIPKGLKRGQQRMRPYTKLYLTKEDARVRKNAIVRPSPCQIA